MTNKRRGLISKRRDAISEFRGVISQFRDVINRVRKVASFVRRAISQFRDVINRVRKVPSFVRRAISVTRDSHRPPSQTGNMVSLYMMGSWRLDMRRNMVWLVILVVFVSTGSVRAHHSLASYDTTQAVRIKGAVVGFYRINPHSFVFLEQQPTDGPIRRWAVEGPSGFQLNRKVFPKDGLKLGDIVEVCGYLPKEPIMWQIATADPSAGSLSGRLINGETMVMPDGHEESWGDYGVHKCFAAEYKDHHSK